MQLTPQNLQTVLNAHPEIHRVGIREPGKGYEPLPADEESTQQVQSVIDLLESLDQAPEHIADHRTPTTYAIAAWHTHMTGHVTAEGAVVAAVHASSYPHTPLPQGLAVHIDPAQARWMSSWTKWAQLDGDRTRPPRLHTDTD